MRKAFFSLLLTSLVGIKPYACNHSVLGGQVTNLPSQCILIRLIKYLIYGAKPMSDYSCNFATNKQFNHIRMKKKNIPTPVLSMAIAACMISHQQNAWGRRKTVPAKWFRALCNHAGRRSHSFNQSRYPANETHRIPTSKKYDRHNGPLFCPERKQYHIRRMEVQMITSWWQGGCIAHYDALSLTSCTYPALRRLCMEAVLSLDSLVCFCNTKISEFFDMAKSWAARLCRLTCSRTFCCSGV